MKSCRQCGALVDAAFCMRCAFITGVWFGLAVIALIITVCK